MKAKSHEILFAGFGGQGILFAGKIMATYALQQDLCVSWLPSYGPEMRGGTAYCAVKISDTEIASPAIYNPTIFVAMNKPSYEKFAGTVQQNAFIFADSSLISDVSPCTHAQCVSIPATKIAHELNMPKLANVVMIGKMIAVTGIASKEQMFSAIEQSVGDKKSMIEGNKLAFMAGFDN